MDTIDRVEEHENTGSRETILYTRLGAKQKHQAIRSCESTASKSKNGVLQSFIL